MKYALTAMKRIPNAAKVILFLEIEKYFCA